jgi:multimeric flavodoxin WrbA
MTRVPPSLRASATSQTATDHSPMPKLLVLFDSRSDDMTRLAEAVAEGARRVRFAEVDLRRIDGASGAEGPTGRHRPLEDAGTLANYDGIIVGAASAAPGAGAAVDQLSSAPSLVNKVGSAFVVAQGGEERREALWSTLTPMADRGMILVPPSVTDAPDDALESARELGKRVADVVGWVTHARSHHHHH